MTSKPVMDGLFYLFFSRSLSPKFPHPLSKIQPLLILHPANPQIKNHPPHPFRRQHTVQQSLILNRSDGVAFSNGARAMKVVGSSFLHFLTPVSACLG
ncbi:hypothetical protein [Desulfonatronovibrio magnus]|uniref:hypothetical protein n=1 Tax=Desulfonatronovibrio magnus TaxID=698827 RepID=UPI0012F7C4B9|nr:hypothetical protein [Desulfonatronovibrio magnus]